MHKNCYPADGRGLTCEICIATGAVRNHTRERNPHLLYSEMQTGEHHMQTMDHAFLDLYRAVKLPIVSLYLQRTGSHSLFSTRQAAKLERRQITCSQLPFANAIA